MEMVKVDIDVNQESAEISKMYVTPERVVFFENSCCLCLMNRSGVPTFQLWVHGSMVEQFSGANKDKLAAMVKKAVQMV